MKAIPDLTSEDLDQMMDLHVKGPFNITQRALPAIIKNKGERFFQHYFLPMKYNLTILTIESNLFTLYFVGTIIFVSSLYQLKPVSIT